MFLFVYKFANATFLCSHKKRPPNYNIYDSGRTATQQKQQQQLAVIAAAVFIFIYIVYIAHRQVILNCVCRLWWSTDILVRSSERTSERMSVVVCLSVCLTLCMIRIVSLWLSCCLWFVAYTSSLGLDFYFFSNSFCLRLLCAHISVPSIFHWLNSHI